MANDDRPRGFQPIGPHKYRKYTAGAKIVPGEFVKLSSDGKVDPAAAGERLLGLCMNLAKVDGDEAYIIDDPYQYYVGQADGADIDAQTDVGNLADILATAEDTLYNAARMEIDSSTIGTGTGGQLRIMDVQERPDNAFGAQADVLVQINEHQYQDATADFDGV